ncbi:hypothetical protein AB0B12_09350 [Streptomyces sp. NPDC044780]|uniref:LmrA/YxaF family transcription factor n=1 Tax=unclassified Streptomyces TaxID=2593676 RepID=UPI0033C9BBA6
MSGSRLGEALREVITGAPAPASPVRAVVELLIGVLTDSGFQRGCPPAAVTLDAATDSAQIRQACAEGYDSWCELIAGFLTGRVPAAERADALATVEFPQWASTI